MGGQRGATRREGGPAALSQRTGVAVFRVRQEERKDVALCIVLLLNRNCFFQAAELIAPWEREEKNGFHSFALKPIQHGLKAEFPYEIPTAWWSFLQDLRRRSC